jgi:hypothetical protein
VRRGVEQLYSGYKDHGLTFQEFTGTRYTRIKHLTSLLVNSRLDPTLRWQAQDSLTERLSAWSRFD